MKMLSLGQPLESLTSKTGERKHEMRKKFIPKEGKKREKEKHLKKKKARQKKKSYQIRW